MESPKDLKCLIDKPTPTNEKKKKNHACVALLLSKILQFSVVESEVRKRRREEVANAYKPAPLGGTGMAPINNCPVSIRFHFPGTSSVLSMPHFTGRFLVFSSNPS